jgi:hypothetical protein
MFIKNNSQINIFNMSFSYNHARMAFSSSTTFNSPSSFKTEKFDLDWVKWLIGFLDAEGNFQTFPKKRVRKDGSVYYNSCLF